MNPFVARAMLTALEDPGAVLTTVHTFGAAALRLDGDVRLKRCLRIERKNFGGHGLLFSCRKWAKKADQSN